MVDPVTLKEALAYEDGELIDLPVDDTWAVIRDAAREYLVFLEGPTDEDVEIAGAAYLNSWAIRQQTPVREHMRAALEAVAEARRQR